MGKIIEFKIPKEKTRLESFVEMAQEAMDETEMDNMLTLSKNPKTGDVYIGVCNMDVGVMQELLGHLQVHIIDKYIQKNYLN